jgi:hypothetical protein
MEPDADMKYTDVRSMPIRYRPTTGHGRKVRGVVKAQQKLLARLIKNSVAGGLAMELRYLRDDIRYNRL